MTIGSSTVKQGSRAEGEQAGGREKQDNTSALRAYRRRLAAGGAAAAGAVAGRRRAACSCCRWCCCWRRCGRAAAPAPASACLPNAACRPPGAAPGRPARSPTACRAARRPARAPRRGPRPPPQSRCAARRPAPQAAATVCCRRSCSVIRRFCSAVGHRAAEAGSARRERHEPPPLVGTGRAASRGMPTTLLRSPRHAPLAAGAGQPRRGRQQAAGRAHPRPPQPPPPRPLLALPLGLCRCRRPPLHRRRSPLLVAARAAALASASSRRRSSADWYGLWTPGAGRRGPGQEGENARNTMQAHVGRAAAPLTCLPTASVTLLGRLIIELVLHLLRPGCAGCSSSSVARLRVATILCNA